MKLIEGGEGSGNYGHGGRPGEVGGSSSSNISGSSKNDSQEVDWYIASGYREINGYLRYGDYNKDRFSGEQIKHAVCALDRVTNEKIPKGTLYRGLSWDVKEGDTFEDKGFVSTTTDKSVARKRAEKFNGKVYRIVGATKGHDVSISIPNENWESEIILPRNLKFKVESGNILRII